VTVLHLGADASTSVRGGTAGHPSRQTAGQKPKPTTAPWLARLSSYLEAVNEHRPGSLDMAARLTGFIGENDLYEIRNDLFALVAICKRELGRSVRPAPIVYRDTLIPFPDLRRILGLTDDEAAKGNANRILQRAAILHADIAMLVIPLLPGRTGCSARATLLVVDGNTVGSGCVSIHWAHGRLLLDAVRPDPGRDPIVRLWYVASITYLLETGDYANGDLQIARARLLLPDDPAILFEHGFYHEGFAAPFIQTAAFESGADTRGAKIHLEEADDLYRRAIKENPHFVEARVHRGFVLGLLGQHRDAAEELRLAVASAAGPRLRYYAELFLGHAEESLGNRAAARGHYTEAAALYPQAQSPLLALALLARQNGDRAETQAAIGKLLALPRDRLAGTDPWWVYYRSQNLGFQAQFAALHAPFLQARTP
jgi:tetratricopeptide (TPR) repeat protein